MTKFLSGHELDRPETVIKESRILPGYAPFLLELASTVLDGGDAENVTMDTLHEFIRQCWQLEDIEEVRRDYERNKDIPEGSVDAAIEADGVVVISKEDKAYIRDNLVLCMLERSNQ